MSYRLLDAFRRLFDGIEYHHRVSVLGDRVASELYEDLVALDKSVKLTPGVDAGTRVLNAANVRVGVTARRGDATFGESVPGAMPVAVPDYRVRRGQVATIEIGVESKILMKAMIKQLDRVTKNLIDQVTEFHVKGGRPLCVALLGINFADYCTAYEGERSLRTDGKKHRHPIQEAAQAEARILAAIRSRYDEILVLRFRATNEPPYPFTWVDEAVTTMEYGAALVRLAREYDRRF